MNNPVQALACACGQVALRVEGKLIVRADCFCAHCQRDAGSPPEFGGSDERVA